MRQIFSILRILFFFISLFDDEGTSVPEDPCPADPPLGGGIAPSDLYNPVLDCSPVLPNIDLGMSPVFNLPEPNVPPTFNFDPDMLAGLLNQDQLSPTPAPPPPGLSPEMLRILANLNDNETNC